jgi:hypothetical protein
MMGMGYHYVLFSKDCRVSLEWSRKAWIGFSLILYSKSQKLLNGVSALGLLL